MYHRGPFTFRRCQGSSPTNVSPVSNKPSRAGDWNAKKAWRSNGVKARGLTLDDTLDLTDPGLSAFHGDNLSEGALGKFLALARAGELGESPVLLVEAIDRLSRLELIDAVQDVIFGLLRAGVTIETLEDGQTYTATRVNGDVGAAILLIAKIHGAAEYSKKLSRRIKVSWDQAIAELEAGRLPRGEVFVPAWCVREGDTVKLIPEKAEIVQKVFDYALSDGDGVVTQRLNEERIPSLIGKPSWTRAQVRNLLTDPRVFGAVRLNNQANMSSKRRARRGERAAEERIFPDLLPLVIPKEEVDQTLAARAARCNKSNPTAARGKRGMTWNIASGFTRCSCGAAGSLASTKSGSRKDSQGQPLVLRYLKCADRCGAKGYRLEAVNGHILTRLHQGQLQQLLASGDDTTKQRIEQESQAIERLQAQLRMAEEQQANSARMFKDALKKGQVDPLFQEAVEEARLEVELAKTALSGAQQRMAALRHDVDTEEFDAAVAELFDAFRSGEDTPAQRQQLNRLLRRAGIRVVLDRLEQRVGMAIGDGPIQWQPLILEAVQEALASGTASAVFEDLTITDAKAKALAAMFPDDQGWAEWLEEMKGVPQVSITSKPPGWDETKIAKALKAAAAEIAKG